MSAVPRVWATRYAWYGERCGSSSEGFPEPPGRAGSPAGSPERPERTPCGGQMRVHEEVVEARVGQVLLDSPAHARAGSGGPRLPRPAWTVCAFRQPAADRRAAEETAVLRRSYRELQADAFVAREEREEAVGGRGADDLEAAGGLERAEGADEIAAGLVEAAPQAKQADSPELHQRQQRADRPSPASERRRLRAGRKALLEEGLQLRRELGACELVGQHRGDARSSPAPAPTRRRASAALRGAADRCRPPPHRASRCHAASGRD